MALLDDEVRNATSETLPLWRRDSQGRVIGVGGPRGNVPIRLPVVLAQSAVPVAHTGSTAAANLATIVIPGGSMGPRGALRVSALFSFTGSVNAKNVRALFGGGPDLFSGYTANAAGNLGAVFDRVLWNRNSETSQICVSTWGGQGSVSSAPTTGTVNSAQDQNLILQVQLALATETITLEGYLVELLPST